MENSRNAAPPKSLMAQESCGKIWASRMPTQREILQSLILNAKKLMLYVNEFASLFQTCRYLMFKCLCQDIELFQHINIFI